jgi:hypothetical protein
MQHKSTLIIFLAPFACRENGNHRNPFFQVAQKLREPVCHPLRCLSGRGNNDKNINPGFSRHARWINAPCPNKNTHKNLW